jgi:hypothetical protein
MSTRGRSQKVGGRTVGISQSVSQSVNQSISQSVSQSVDLPNYLPTGTYIHTYLYLPTFLHSWWVWLSQLGYYSTYESIHTPVPIATIDWRRCCW